MYKKYYIVGVRFKNSTADSHYTSKEYTYFATEPFRPAEIVVVDTRYGPQIAQVSSESVLSKNDRSKASKLIIAKVDMTKVEAEYKIMTELENLREQLDERRKAIEDVAVLRLLAQTDDMARDILNRIYDMTGDKIYLPEPKTD